MEPPGIKINKDADSDKSKISKLINNFKLIKTNPFVIRYASNENDNVSITLYHNVMFNNDYRLIKFKIYR